MVKRIHVNMTEREYGLWMEYIRGRGHVGSLSAYIRLVMNKLVGMETKPFSKGGRPPWRHNAKFDGETAAAASQAVCVRVGSEPDAPVKVSAAAKKLSEIEELFSERKRPSKELCPRCARIGVALCEECLK